MAIVVGTNAGFVTVAPTTDPEGGGNTIQDGFASANEHVSPAGNNIITEIGWYASSDTADTNFEVGIYTDGGLVPDAVVGSLSQTNAKGSGIGWKVATGLSIPLSASTTYWIAMQLDDGAGDTTIDFQTGIADEDLSEKGSQTTLTDPFVSGTTQTADLVKAIYALVEPVVSATDNMTIIGENVY